MQHLTILIALSLCYITPSVWGRQQSWPVVLQGVFVSTILAPTMLIVWEHKLRAMTPSQRMRYQGASEILMSLLLLASFASTLWIFAWRHFLTVRLHLDKVILLDDLLCFFPFLLSLLLCWFIRYKLGLQRHAQGIFHALMFQCRMHGILIGPIFLFLGMMDCLPYLPDHVQEFFAFYPLLSSMGSGLLFILLSYVLSPFAIRLMWATSPLQHSALALYLRDFCRKTGFRYRAILVWHTGGTGVANAAVAGPFAWCRYIFLSDELIHCMNRQEIEAVLAHEIGHIRHHHLLQYLIFIFGSVAMHLSVWTFAENRGMDPMLMVIVGFVLYWGVLFGMLSRRLEHQADWFAVNLTGSPGIFAYCLEKLSIINGMHKQRSGWRHPSISRRIQFIQQAHHDPSALNKFRLHTILVKCMCLGVVAASLHCSMPTLRDEWRTPEDVKLGDMGDYWLFLSDDALSHGNAESARECLRKAHHYFSRASVKNPQRTEYALKRQATAKALRKHNRLP